MKQFLLCALVCGLAACTANDPQSNANEPIATEGSGAEDGAPEAGSGEASIGGDSADEDGRDPLAAPADVAAAPDNAEVTASGLASTVLTVGNGTEFPAEEDTVEVHYTGWTTDGEMFDSSVERGATASFPLNRVIAGWTEGLQLMVTGEKRRFWIPVDLAYQNRPGRPAGMLVFDVELISITKAPEPVTAHDDVAAAPAYAETTEAGTGTENPTAASTVTVHYSGWTTDGEMFDSSVMRGQPASFPLNGVIAGWTEGLQLMVTGETRRFWIPVDLAYQNMPGRPAGMLVFDVELISIP
jgi:peptidylprolyl isomerase